jgi:hypothetical protein
MTARPVTFMLTFECPQDLLRMVDQLDQIVDPAFGGRDAWLTYVVATAIEQYKEHGTFFPQDNQDTIADLIDEINEMQQRIDAVDSDVDELRQRANAARSTTEG